jgi:hypothetical protein
MGFVEQHLKVLKEQQYTIIFICQCKSYPKDYCVWEPFYPASGYSIFKSKGEDVPVMN